MSYRTPATVIVFAVCTISPAAIFAQSSMNDPAVARSRYLPQYTASGELILPRNSMWREWAFVGSTLSPNTLNVGHANFPEYHNVYIEPGSYAIYEKTGAFPEGTILFKELQLTLKPEENSDGSRTEPSRRGYFPGAFNGAGGLSRTRSAMQPLAVRGTSISIILNQRLRPPREREIVIHVLQGRLSKQIAHDLGISEATVKVHRSNLMRKMSVRSLPELGKIADKLKLVSEKT